MYIHSLKSDFVWEIEVIQNIAILIVSISLRVPQIGFPVFFLPFQYTEKEIKKHS